MALATARCFTTRATGAIGKNFVARNFVRAPVWERGDVEHWSPTAHAENVDGTDDDVVTDTGHARLVDVATD